MRSAKAAANENEFLNIVRFLIASDELDVALNPVSMSALTQADIPARCDIDAVTQRPQDTVSSVLDYLGLGLL
jgi:hypothetical protein